MKPFEFVKSINLKTGNIIDIDAETERHYIPFFVNKNFSLFADTILCANVINGLYDLPKKMQYDYYYGCIKKKNRFCKWTKPEEEPVVDMIVEYYKVNRNRAKEYISIMTPEDIENLSKITNTGGPKK
jgi:hypothetical protein